MSVKTKGLQRFHSCLFTVSSFYKRTLGKKKNITGVHIETKQWYRHFKMCQFQVTFN